MTCNRRMLSVLALLAASFSMTSHGETQQGDRPEESA